MALNIAEGSTGQTNPEFGKFIGYAIRSAIEVVSCLFIARERQIISKEDFNKLYVLSEEISKMLSGFIKTL